MLGGCQTISSRTLVGPRQRRPASTSCASRLRRVAAASASCEVELGFALRQSLELGRRRRVVVPSRDQGGLGGIRLSFEVIARRGRLRQFDLELRLAFSQRGRRGRHGRRVLPFRLTPRRLDLCQLLLDIGPRRAFLPDQPLELCVARGGVLGGCQTISSGTLVGPRQRRPRIDQLRFEAAPRHRGFRKLRGELGFALRQSLDLGRRRRVVVPSRDQGGLGGIHLVV